MNNAMYDYFRSVIDYAKLRKREVLVKYEILCVCGSMNSESVTEMCCNSLS